MFGADGDAYRYGFNGKLKDNEWSGIGNSEDYGFRMLDTRIARFRSVDPLTKKFPHFTPYAFAGNTPIRAIDLEGLEIMDINSSMYRMRYLGEFPSSTKAGQIEMVPANHVDIVKANAPSAYPLDNSYNVGTHGHDNPDAKPYMGPVFKEREGEPYEGSDFPEEEKDGPPSKAENAYTATTGAVEAFKWGKKVFTGNMATFALVFQEPHKRRDFYKATNVVDKALNTPELKKTIQSVSKLNSEGNFRADLINYITDGTKPSNYQENMSAQEKANYNKQVITSGKQIMQAAGIKIQTTN